MLDKYAIEVRFPMQHPYNKYGLSKYLSNKAWIYARDVIQLVLSIVTIKIGVFHTL